MLEYRYDTQLLIDGDDLDEDEVAEYFTKNFQGDCLLAETVIRSRFTTIRMSRGRCWNIAEPSERSMTSSSRIWTGRHAV